MHRRLAALAVVAATAVATAACGGDTAGTGNAGLEAIGAGLSGPPGVTAAVYATGLVHASAFAVDDAGRLWVATAAAQDDGTDAVYVVPTAGATPVPVITGLHTPLGLLWSGGRFYVASAGRVDVESGFDGTRFASSQTVVTLPAGSGEANGLAQLPNGRIALGVSAPCDHCSTSPADSAAVLTFQADGSDLQVEASGIRAPVGLTVDPGTGQLLVTMNQRDDLEDTPGDWLAVVQPGQDWGFPDCYGQSTAECAGTPPPLAVLDPHAAVSGVAVVRGQLGSSVGTAALVAEWATGTVRRVDLSPGHEGEVTPFLTGAQRPEPLLTTPQGTVLVGDWGTGTVYELRAAGG